MTSGPSSLRKAINIEDLRKLTKRRLPRAIFEFFDGGAEDEASVRNNRAQFERWGLLPRYAINVAERDTATTLFGEKYSAPFVISPTGMAGLARSKAELHLAKAAHRMGIPFAMSTVSSVSIEEVATKSPGPRWFQLYIIRDRDYTLKLMRRAEEAGYGVLLISIDCPVGGARERDPRNGLQVPLRPTIANVLDLARRPSWIMDVLQNGAPRPENLVGASGGGAGGQALAAYMQSQLDPSVTWEDVAWIRSLWKGPLIVKGVLSPEDARAALNVGADGVVVSNHGGRQLDHAVPPLELLPAVVDAVGHRGTVLCDSGFRRGTDILKALALGAKGVLLGRATLFGAAAAGEAGAYRALEILKTELDRAMALTGCVNIESIGPDKIWDLVKHQPASPISTASEDRVVARTIVAVRSQSEG